MEEVAKQNYFVRLQQNGSKIASRVSVVLTAVSILIVGILGYNLIAGICGLQTISWANIQSRAALAYVEIAYTAMDIEEARAHMDAEGAIVVNGEQIYVVKYGDTLTGISGAFQVGVDKIANRNAVEDVNLIYAGDEMVIPEKPARVYVIEDGDTLTSIAEKLGVDMNELAAMNEIRDNDVISAGSTLGY